MTAERTRVLDRVRSRLASVRDRSPAADHGVRAVDRYLEVQGSLLAAAVSYYGFLALFPLIAVVFGVTSVLSRVAPSVEFARGVDSRCDTCVTADPGTEGGNDELTVADRTHRDLLARVQAGSAHRLDGKRHLVLRGHPRHSFTVSLPA